MSEENDSSKPRFLLLNGQNYSTWKFKMTMLLKDKALWGFAIGTAALPANPNETDRARHEQRSDKALATICLGLDDNQQVYVENATTAKEAWDSLKCQYEKSTLSNKLFLRRRFLNMSMSETDSMVEHISKVRSLATQLAQIGAPVTDDDLVTTLLCSLPPSYDSLITALGSRDPADLTVAFVTGRLQHEADKRMNKAASPMPENDPQSAMVAKTKHFRKPQCYYCNRFGHVKSECRKLKRLQDRKAGNDAHSSEAQAEESDEAQVVYEAFVSSKERDQYQWVVDSAATRHMTSHRKWFQTYQRLPEGKVKVRVGNGNLLDVPGQGEVELDLVSGTKAVLQDVLHVPHLTKNLFSVKAAAKTGAETRFSESGCEIRKEGKMVAKGSSHNGLYWLACVTVCAVACFSGACIKPASAEVWHNRLGHINFRDLMKVQAMTTGMELTSTDRPSICHGCQVGKMARSPFLKKTDKESREVGELVHTDITGPMQVESHNRKKYFITFIDEASRMVAVYFMREKSEALDFFKEYVAMVSNQVGKRVKRLRSDNGSEYLSKAFTEYCSSEGILQETSAPYTPQQNGLAERMNRTLVETARSMLLSAELPSKYWVHAVSTAAHIRNRCPTSPLPDMTPVEAFTGLKPDVSYFKTFGCRAYVKIPDAQRRKWDPKAVHCRFLGYEGASYRFVEISNGRIHVSRDVSFDKDDEFHKATNDAETQFESSNAVSTDESQETKEPKSFEEAKTSSKSKEWLKAAHNEYDSLQETGTWELVELQKGRQAISSKWVFKLKHRADGTVEKYKARLVARGFSQEPGIDYEETFAPVVKMQSVRCLLALSAQHDWELHQMDVKTAFLNGDLQEEIYMEQPEGFTVKGKEHLVCRLRRSLYGLKQAARCWNKNLDDYLKHKGFIQSAADCCVYVKFEGNSLVIIAAYVDDLIIATNDKSQIAKTKAMLSSGFQMSDLGELHCCLGMVVTRNRQQGSINIRQTKYIQSILQKFEMSECKEVKSPMDKGLVLPKLEQAENAQLKRKYQQAVGMLFYLSHTTRPDIANAVRIVSQHASAPGEAHYSAVKRILRYLKGTQNLGIAFKRSADNALRAYVDADWAGDVETRRSCSGYVFFLHNGPVSWASKIQANVALSTAESEYVAASLACQEAMWLKQLLKDLQHEQGTIEIQEDNQSCLAMINNPVLHGRSKHLDIKLHFVREKVAQKLVHFSYCPTEDMIADIFTKSLEAVRFKKLSAQILGIRGE